MRGPKKQQGVILAITMIMLLLLTIIGLSSMSMATLEERMAGNSLDRNYALQAAEMALRDAELDILLNLKPSAFLQLTPNAPCNAQGLCLVTNLLDASPWENVNWKDKSQSRNYGAYTGKSFANSAELINKIQKYLDDLPQYVVEFSQQPGCDVWTPGGKNGAGKYYEKYRTTSHAVGASPSARVELQSVFKRRNGYCQSR